jgi:serine/threonine-protein kinase
MSAATSPDQVRALGPGTVVAGKLKLVKAVGEGGMGKVWRARNLATGANVAVKVLRPKSQDDEHAVDRFRYEARLGAMLAHRNITRVFDLLEEADGSLVLVMELLQGETLRDYLKRVEKLPTREAVAIMVAVLSGLQHAHEHGVVHRDLKPTNVLLHVDSDGTMLPKLLDFGIAKAKDSSIETQTGETLGTPSYMSPEQVRAIDLDGRSDLFSCASVLYELIAGTNPFTASSPSATLANVLEQDVDPDPRIDPRVWLEMKRSLSKPAYQRHATAKDFADALCKAVGETETALVQSLQRESDDLPMIDAFDDAGMDVDAGGRTLQMAGAPKRPMSWPALRPLVVAGAALVVVTIGIVLIVRSWSSSADTPATTEPAASIEPAASAEPAASTGSPIELDDGPNAGTVSAPPSTAAAPGPRDPAPTPRRPRPHSSGPPAPTPTKHLARTPGF